MPSFSGRFELTGGRGPQSGSCVLSFGPDTLQLVSGGTPIVACDLGDIDVVAPGDCVVDLTLFDGQHLRLSHFAKTFDNLVHDLLEAYRDRLVKCLLLEDLEEVARFDGTIACQGARTLSGPAEIRLYGSNVAFLPVNETGLQWRLADVDSVQFDAGAYAVVLQSGDEQIRVTKLAKRTDELREKLDAAIQAVGERTAAVLHDLFPFVAPGRFADLARLMKEGHAVSLAALQGIDPKTRDAITSRVVDETLRPYFEELRRLAGDAGTFAGFKMIRADDADPTAEPPGETATAAEAVENAEEARETEEEGDNGEEPPVLYWFFFRIAPPASREPALAWEATSRSGRATYLFREDALMGGRGAPASPDAAASRLARGLALINFRREPVYLSDDSLRLQPKFRRYAIANRRLPEVATLRRAFAGRAIHTSPDAWLEQLKKPLASS